jgi:hypothetical protein
VSTNELLVKGDYLGIVERQLESLARAIQRDIKDEDLRIELMVRLLEVKRKLSERDGDDGRTDN